MSPPQESIAETALNALSAMSRASADRDLPRALSRLLAIVRTATQSDGCGASLLVGPDATRLELCDGEAPILGPGKSADVALRDRDLRLLSVPGIAEGRHLGALLVGRHGADYASEEVSLASLLAAHFGLHVENARMHADAQRSLDETQLFLDVARAVTASLELEPRLEAAADVLSRMIDASNTFILMLDESESELAGVACTNPAHRQHFRQVRIPMTASSIAVTAMRSRAPIVIADTDQTADLRRELVDTYGEKSLLALPLIAHGSPIGAVVVDDTRRARSWTRAEIERAELIAHQVAVAVANSRLYDKVKQGYTDLARAQQELVKRERLAALGELAATLAHEVRNPLGVIFNSIGTLQKQLPPSGDTATLLAIMGEEARRLNELVTELLDFARPTTAQLEAQTLAPILEDAIEDAHKHLGQDGCRIDLELAPGIGRVQIDARMFRRALVNLLVNASQAAGPDGTVVARVSRSGEEVLVEVEDSGPGIWSAALTRIFEPFFTTKARGTGLGLAIVKNVVDSHGGTVSVATTPKTCFTIRLPAS